MRPAFPYHDRFKLIEQGITGIDKVTLHPGSAYLISRATFPGYFLKEQGWWMTATARLTSQLFRERLAPALQITHRFVGTEPLCPLTRQLQPAHEVTTGSAGRRAAH